MEGGGDNNDNYMDLFDNTVDRVMNLLNFEVVPRNQIPQDENIDELKKNLNSERERRIDAEKKLLETEIKINLINEEFGNFISKLFDSLTVDPLSKSHFLRIGTFKSESERDDWVVKLRNLGSTLQNRSSDDNGNKMKLLKSFNENSMSILNSKHSDPPAPKNGSEIQTTQISNFKIHRLAYHKKQLGLKHGVNLTESSANKHVCTCGKEFVHLKNLCMHIRRTNLTEWKFKCGGCGIRFFQPIDLKRHVEKVQHVGTHLFCCTFCIKRFDDEEDLKHHVRISHSFGKFLQNMLVNEHGGQSSTLSPRKDDKAEERSNNQGEYFCVCGFTTVSSTTLKYHIRLLRGDTKSVHRPCIPTFPVQEETRVDDGDIICVD